VIGRDAHGLVLDLGNVTFIDSAGLRVLLRMAKPSHRNGGRLSLLRVSAPVDRAIGIAGVESPLRLAD
jgi:anti-anti-sigma factor